MTRRATPARLALAGLALLALTAFLLWVLPSNTYIFLPDKAHPVAPIVRVQGGDDPTDGGGIYYVDIFVRKASLLERLWPGIREGGQLVPASAVVPPGSNERLRREADRRDMTRSQQIAAAVALRAAGYDVVARPTGVLVDGIDPDADAIGKLQRTDVIVQADDVRVRAPADLRRAVGRRRPGDEITLVVRRGSEQRRVTVKTMADRAHPRRALIGILVDQAAFIKLPLRVTIDAGNVGGPSAGLAFALDVLEELGRDVDGGRRIAVTGALELDGTVTPIGGVRQKALGVQRSGIDVFVVPAGENAAEARRYAGGVRIVAVRSFQQALRALATLPKSA